MTSPDIGHRTIISGFIIYEDGAGDRRAIRFKRFEAWTDTPWIDLVDKGVELTEEKLPKGREWLQVDERIKETPIVERT